MTKPNLVILGGSEDQLPAYLEARRLGYHVIGVDRNPGSHGAFNCDQFLCVTTRDPEAIATALGDIDVAAVISPASDASQAAVAALSKRFRTAHQVSDNAVRASQDKAYFHSVIKDLGFPGYVFAQSDDLGHLRASARDMTYPLVVKPTDSSGSKGLNCVDVPEDLDVALAVAAEHSFTGEVIIEELVAGGHYSVECFAQHGQPVLSAVTERTITPLPHMITVSHLLPATLGCALRGRLQDMITAIFAEIGHRNGPVNFDFVLTEDRQIAFVEMGARLGGNGMPMLVRQAFGINTVEAAIRLAAGEEIDLSQHPQPRSVMLHILTSPHDGMLEQVDGLDEARQLPGVVELRTFKEPGDPVRQYTQAANKLGYLVVRGDTRDDLASNFEKAMSTVKFTVKTDTKDVERVA